MILNVDSCDTYMYNMSAYTLKNTLEKLQLPKIVTLDNYYNLFFFNFNLYAIAWF